MKIVGIKTWSHVGDVLIMTAAAWNFRARYPEYRFKYIGAEAYRPLLENNPDFVETSDPVPCLPALRYGPGEQTAERGSCASGQLKTLCEWLCVDEAPLIDERPVIRLYDSEDEWGRQFDGAVIVNANCQLTSRSKANPWLADVSQELARSHRVIQVGGNEERDISEPLPEAEDWRGRTTLRELAAMVAHCRLVVSPPSGITHVAGAWDIPQVIVNAGREPDALTPYRNAVHVSRKYECGWGGSTGCLARTFDGSSRLNCDRCETVDGRQYASCQVDTTSADIMRSISRLPGIF